jgi:hypothetical protein
MTRFSAAILIVLLGSLVYAAVSADAQQAVRNEHNYILELDLPHNIPHGGWSGDVAFTISACPQAQCFHVSGRVSVPPFSMNRMEGSFPLAGLPCELHFQNIPRKVGQYYMDSPDWRVTLISRNESGNGCASLPPELAGDYTQVANQ